jgi:dynein heavy chain 2
VQTGEEMKVQLASLEKQLLEELATSQGNILDNRALVASLNETKVKSTTVATSLLESQALQVTLFT